MPVSIPIPTTSGYQRNDYLNNQSHEERSQLGKDQFLRILIAQLKYQDPMQPLQDKEFIAQMAQFSAVESLSSMSKEFASFRNSLGNASMLIDREVSWMEYNQNDGKWVSQSGVVNSIIMKENLPYAVVGDKQIAIDDISSVKSVNSVNENPENSEQPTEIE